MNAVSLAWLLTVVLKIISLADGYWVTGNLCWSMPCLNGGSCFGSAYTYLCVCPIQFSGILCERRLGICQENPCGNRGLCIEKSLTSYECRCYYSYAGPTCKEHVMNKDRNIWSSLLPAHTQILFSMLQQAYRVKAEEKGVRAPKNGQVDFIGLLSTLVTPTMIQRTLETITTTDSNETTEKNLIIQAHDIQLEKIFPEQSTAFLEDFSHQTTEKMAENITTTTTTESDLFQTTDHQGMINITTPDSIETTNGSAEPINFISSSTDEKYSSDQVTTLPIQRSSSPATTLHSAHSYLLSKLCQKIFSHISPNSSLSSNSSSIYPSNRTANSVFSWLSKQLSSPTTTTNSTLPSLVLNEVPSSGSLQRINMDDVLHQMDNYIDEEHDRH